MARSATLSGANAAANIRPVSTTAATRVSREERRRLIHDETTRCIELYREHESTDAVARILGVKRSRVLRRIRDAEVNVGMLRIEHTVELFNTLGSVQAVAAHMRLGEMTVRKRLFSAVVLGLLDEVPEITAEVEALRAARESRRLDPEKEAETVALYRELRSLRAVGNRLGLTAEAVRLRLKNAGEETRRVERLTDEEREAAIRLYYDLKSVQAVAVALNRSPVTIRRVLAKADVEVKHGAWHETKRDVRFARKVGEAEVMKRLFDELGSEIQVAQLLGVSQTLVSARLGLIGAAPGRGNHLRGPRAAGAQRARAVYEDCGSARETAEHLGVSYRTALRYLHADGVPLRGHQRSRPHGEGDIERTYAIYRETYSVEETAARIGRSQRTVLRHLQRVREQRAAQRALRFVDVDAPVPLDPPDEWEMPTRLPVWMREEDLIWPEVDDLRTLERTAQGKYICPLCGLKTWGISRHLRQPHARCPEPECDRIVVASGVPAHRWNMHVRPRIERPAATRRGELVVLRQRDVAACAAAS
jgi:transposase-like protein